ncbi:hypothetical protein ACFQ1I_02465 [Kitasatospora arboriphila]
MGTAVSTTSHPILAKPLFHAAAAGWSGRRPTLRTPTSACWRSPR